MSVTADQSAHTLADLNRAGAGRGGAASPTVGPSVPAVLYRVDEAAEALRLSRSSIYELIRSGQLRTVKHGSRRLVPVEALDEFVQDLARAVP